MVDFLLLIVTMSSPLLLMAMAGYASERSGIINIGLEGKMLTACFVCAAFSPQYGAIGGVLMAILAGTLISLLHWTLTQVYRIDHIISGMAINLLASGGTGRIRIWQRFDTGHSPTSLDFVLYHSCRQSDFAPSDG